MRFTQNEKHEIIQLVEDLQDNILLKGKHSSGNKFVSQLVRQ